MLDAAQENQFRVVVPAPLQLSESLRRGEAGFGRFLDNDQSLRYEPTAVARGGERLFGEAFAIGRIEKDERKRLDRMCRAEFGGVAAEDAAWRRPGPRPRYCRATARAPRRRRRRTARRRRRATSLRCRARRCRRTGRARARRSSDRHRRAMRMLNSASRSRSAVGRIACRFRRRRACAPRSRPPTMRIHCFRFAHDLVRQPVPRLRSGSCARSRGPRAAAAVAAGLLLVHGRARVLRAVIREVRGFAPRKDERPRLLARLPSRLARLDARAPQDDGMGLSPSCSITGAVEIGARLCGERASPSCSRSTVVLDFLDRAVGQFAELERPEGDADQPVHLQPEMVRAPCAPRGSCPRGWRK